MNAMNSDRLTTSHPETLAGSNDELVGLPFIPSVATYTLDDLVIEVTKIELVPAQVDEVEIIAVNETGGEFEAVCTGNQGK